MYFYTSVFLQTPPFIIIRGMVTLWTDLGQQWRSAMKLLEKTRKFSHMWRMFGYLESKPHPSLLSACVLLSWIHDRVNLIYTAAACNRSHVDNPECWAYLSSIHHCVIHIKIAAEQINYKPVAQYSWVFHWPEWNTGAVLMCRDVTRLNLITTENEPRPPLSPPPPPPPPPTLILLRDPGEVVLSDGRSNFDSPSASTDCSTLTWGNQIVYTHAVMHSHKFPYKLAPAK